MVHALDADVAVATAVCEVVTDIDYFVGGIAVLRGLKRAIIEMCSFLPASVKF